MMPEIEPILVTSVEASAWTGRPQGTIWRWASEGRIKRHVTSRGVKYNLMELPAKTESGPAQAPPLPHNRPTAEEVVPA